MNNKSKLIFLIIFLVIISSIGYHIIIKKFAGIQNAKMMGMPTKVEVTKVKKQKIYDSIDFVGRIEAEKEIKLVSRVNGWLQKKFYQDGDFVKKGQLLFQIEPDEYILAVKNAEATLRQIQASYDNSLVELKRAKELVKGDYVSRSYYDQSYAKYAADKASVDAAKAALNTAKLNLGYTKIYAPFDGKVGQLYIDEGNYVTAQTGQLANLITINPIYATFTIKQNDLRRFQNPDKNSPMPDVIVQLKLSDGKIYDEKGTLDFMDNKIDKDMGTILLRATFNNNHQKLIPNDFVRVILTANRETEVTLIPQSAVLESVNSKYVWTIDENNCAKQKDIEIVGPYKEYWILQSGLNADDKIIATNLQSIRQGAKVQIVELSEEDKAKKELAKKEAIEYSMTDRPNQKNNTDKVNE
ncbi:efflux RND transporter periplasmic adaptor subunit [bacterium]|nr:efflux RND transporter periplasmic adaptor subunit [bacterium]